MRNPMKASRALEQVIDKDDSPRRTKDDDMQFRRQKAVPKKARIVPYIHNPDLAHPKVGDTLSVCHRTNADGNGNARVSRSDIEQRTIKQVYMSTAEGFSIKDHVGDTWLVRPAALGGTTWETFTVGEKQKVR